ncbi:bifunctional uridylyltransferase/uridylyl-removing protein GlnD [Celerinatantimonas yamalensis]|uniref:Bifunctional uridylyltransferase/uridylyl-removing enzyme n=1 Tax=Celerinatantimonas yamalensis TaxID=559956 RepID=A0ABW9G839_9GAMM
MLSSSVDVAPQLPQLIGVSSCKAFLKAQHNWLQQQFHEHVPVTQLVQKKAQQIDQLLQQLWQHFQLHQYQDISLIAVGGYGRGELHPKSDIDILILVPSTLHAEIQQQLSDFITFLWDIKLDVGQSVRTLSECLELGKQDITIATNLIESRLISGNHFLYQRLNEQVNSELFWPIADFFRAKQAEQQNRHRHYKDSAYSLEPDLKANPGGLRDIQTIAWVAGKHFGSSDLAALAEHGFLTLAEYRELENCRDFLWRVRFALHLQLIKADNRLLFDRQLSVAQTMGYKGQRNEPVEQLMKEFFQTIRRVSELNEMLLQLFNEAILGNTAMDVRPLNADFIIRGTLIDTISCDLFVRQPEQILDMFLLIAEHEQITGVYSSTLRQLREARRRQTTFLEDSPLCRQKFRKLVKHPRITGLPITLMHRYGVLAAYFQAWSQIVGQMQFDLFHAYTVDEHTHRLIKHINEYPQSESRQHYPLASEIYERLERPDLLVLAALFHDIAKGRKGDHSKLGAIEAENFCLRHNFSRPSARTVAWLVEHHLSMSVTAQRRDIYDPDVITEFAKLVRDKRHLDMLFCLTVADICATNDDVWNSWKGTLMRELYQSTLKALRLGLENPVDLRGLVREKQHNALDLLLERGFSGLQVQTIWQRFRVDYFLRHTPEQIAWHSEYLWGHSNAQPLILISRRASRGGTEIFIYSKDIPHLFASVANEMEQKNLNIHDAQIMSSRDGYVLDTFIVLDPDGQPISPERQSLIKDSLMTMLHFGRPATLEHRPLSRQVRQFKVATQVDFLPTRGNRTLMELVTLDRPGLLASVGAVLQSLNYIIQGSKITTIGERAEDFFIISREDRTRLDDHEQQQLKIMLEQRLDQEVHAQTH